ncbi:MAG: hypothetical protein ABI183_16555, partial [Polyangiaceae bacterium]
RNRRFAIASLLTAIAGTCATFAFGVADAQPASPIDLTWNAPAGCSDSPTILAEVMKLRGDGAAIEQMTATATVALDASGVWSLHITTNFADGTHGERQIQAESCRAAAEATASILALALTSRAGEIAAAPTTAIANSNLDAGASVRPEIADASAPTAIPTAVAVADAGPTFGGDDLINQPFGPKSPDTKTPLHIYFGGNFGGTVGDFPSAGLGGGGDFGVMYGLLRAEAYANVWALGRASFATGGGANFQLFSAGLRTCLSFGDTFSVGPCAAFELGSMSAESFGVTGPSSGSALASDGFLGALGTFSLDKKRLISLRALLEVGATFQRPTFVLDGASFAYQPGPLVGRGTFGAEIRF